MGTNGNIPVKKMKPMLSKYVRRRGKIKGIIQKTSILGKKQYMILFGEELVVLTPDRFLDEKPLELERIPVSDIRSVSWKKSFLGHQLVIEEKTKRTYRGIEAREGASFTDILEKTCNNDDMKKPTPSQTAKDRLLRITTSRLGKTSLDD